LLPHTNTAFGIFLSIVFNYQGELLFLFRCYSIPLTNE